MDPPAPRYTVEPTNQPETHQQYDTGKHIAYDTACIEKNEKTVKKDQKKVHKYI